MSLHSFVYNRDKSLVVNFETRLVSCFGFRYYVVRFETKNIQIVEECDFNMTLLREI